MKTLAIIPARYASTRFPGKPLAMIHDRPMIQWVYERTSSCAKVDDVLVATDDERIVAAVRAFGGQVVMTSSDHATGTDRLQEAVQKTGSTADLILNVQGDEPAIDPLHLERLIDLFELPIDIGTLVTPFRSYDSFIDPNRVKAILAESGKALYFTRAAAPYDRADAKDFSQCYQHLGVYAYRRQVLADISKLPSSPLERKESLEQLRWLEHGYTIHAAIVAEGAIGVDTLEDLEKVKGLLS